MQFVQRRLNSAFRFGIQCGRRFIQNQDWAVTQQRARNRNTLTLTSATNVTEVSVYERSTIPNSVKEGAAVMKSTRSAVRLPL